jgi:hypothetical protein
LGIEEENKQTKSTDSLSNNITVENSPNLKKERDIQEQEAFKMPTRHNHQTSTAENTSSNPTQK